MTPAWFENDDFWNAVEPILFDEERLAKSPEEVGFLIELLNPAPGAAILDLCCGTGRHAVELASRGYKVTGVDRTPAYLNAARESAEGADLSATWTLSEMLDYREPNTFNCVINMFTSFGYYESPKDNERVLENIFASLRPGGAALLDLMGKETVARDFQPQEWREWNGTILLESREIQEDWTHIHNRWEVISPPENGKSARQSYEFSHWLYSAAELHAMLLGAGFRAVSIYGSLSGEPYDDDAERLVAIARK